MTQDQRDAEDKARAARARVVAQSVARGIVVTAPCPTCDGPMGIQHCFEHLAELDPVDVARLLRSGR